MTVKELIEKTNWECLSGNDILNKEITGCFSGDLLSWVMGNGEKGQLWITVLTHLNVIAVAVLNEFSCVVVAQNAEVEDQVIERAKSEGVILLRTGLSAFEISRKCVELNL